MITICNHNRLWNKVYCMSRLIETLSEFIVVININIGASIKRFVNLFLMHLYPKKPKTRITRSSKCISQTIWSICAPIRKLDHLFVIMWHSGFANKFFLYSFMIFTFIFRNFFFHLPIYIQPNKNISFWIVSILFISFLGESPISSIFFFFLKKALYL